MKTQMLIKAITVGCVTTVLSTATLAEPNVEALVRRLELMEQELKELKQQLKKTASKEEVQLVTQTVAAAAEWRQTDALIHIAGYADVGYADTESEDGSFNVGTFSPIFHFNIVTWSCWNQSWNLKWGDDGETETNLEYLTIDWFLNDYIAVIGGKFLSPIGQFQQNLRPSWINKFASAPPGFGHDGAATVSELGVQLRGAFPIAGLRTNYAIYASNGPELNAVDEDGEIELEGIEAEGFGVDGDVEKTYGGRFAILPIPALELAVSA